MYSREPTGSLVTLGGHLRVVLHSQDDATVAAESTDPPSSLANEHISSPHPTPFCTPHPIPSKILWGI
ncbi:hypothetical protein M0804_009282 [Polistes exclamans]|nr:hypothetical protein M0804_009282 [Polistes exclamans]